MEIKRSNNGLWVSLVSVAMGCVVEERHCPGPLWLVGNSVGDGVRVMSLRDGSGGDHPRSTQCRVVSGKFVEDES